MDAARVVMLQAGEVPIPERGLDELIRRNATADRLQSTLDAEHGVNHRTIVFISVGTPASEDGSAAIEHAAGDGSGLAIGPSLERTAEPTRVDPE